MKKVLVRFPNESDYQEITIEIFKFKPEKFFESEIFGYYDNMYIAIKIEKNQLNQLAFTLLSENKLIKNDARI